MSTTSTGALPTRSDIANWSNDHLESAAEQWGKQADQSEQAFEQRLGNVTAPAGTEFRGRAADAAYDDANTDLATVRRESQGLREMATIARNGKQELDEIRRMVVQAIQDAQRSGFNVSENLEVTQGHGGDGSAKSNAAQQHQDYIRWRASQLVAAESRIAQQLHAKADALGGGSGAGGDGTVHMLDDGTVAFPDHGKWQYNLDLTSSLYINDVRTHPSAGADISADDVWRQLNKCFNCNFPIPGAPHDFPKVGDVLPLHMGLGVKDVNLAVKVLQLDKTGDEINIKFETMPGHVDGPGSTIAFRWHNQDGQMHLGINAVVEPPGPGTGGPLTGAFARQGYTMFAVDTWQPYIDNVTRNIQLDRGHTTAGGPLGPPVPGYTGHW